MKTYIDRIDTNWGEGWGVILDDNSGALIEFRTKKNATTFRKFIAKIDGDTLEAKYDNYISSLIDIYCKMGHEHSEAFAIVAHNHG